MDYLDIAERMGFAVDAVGILVIIVGALVATGAFAWRLRGERWVDAYQEYRRGLGRAILLGLEFLVAGDIIRTVAIELTFENLGILAGLIAIRTVLSFSLEVELTGAWPWQRGEEGRQSGA